MKVLLSIKPEYVEKIFSGEKRFEYRKAIFRRSDIRTIVIYATMPIGMIVGEFRVAGVIKSRPQELWDKTALFSGISREKFQAYFDGRNSGYAICIGSLVKYSKRIDPFELYPSFIPPQSFRYVD
jgi:predicted transcriptional regulator